MKVIIIGCSISGPVLAMLLQKIGHNPVIYERRPSPSPDGIGLQVSPQSMKVLRILGLDERVRQLGKGIRKWRYTSQISERVLFENDGMGAVLEREFGWPVYVVPRAEYNKLLVDETVKRGIPVHFGKRLVDVTQEGERVRAVFEDGTTDEGDLLVGCDGLRSSVRDVVWGSTKPAYTGVVTVAGTATRPEEVDPEKGYQIFGDGCHFFVLPFPGEKVMWGCTRTQEAESKENWKTADPRELVEIVRELPPSGWGGMVGEVLGGVRSAAKFAMYKRPIPKEWHKGRVVLCGDAAHPALPYLGQGANQCQEDCYHLVRLLKQAGEPLTSEKLEAVLTSYEQLREPRVAKTTEQAEWEGRVRTMKGKEACAERDEMLAQGMQTRSWKVVMEMLGGPYDKESEI